MPMTPVNPARRIGAALLGASLVIGLPAMAGTAPALAEDTTTTTEQAAGTAVAAPVSYALGERTLRRGDTGADVTALQKYLGVKRTGKFTKRTRKAVKKVQRAAGLKANGVVKKKTLKAVKKAAKARKRAAAASRSLPRAGSPTASKRYAKAYIAQKYGWNSTQMSCLSTLWTRESGWRYWVSNPNGRYHGIPQTSSAVWRPLGYSTSQYMRSPEVQIKVGTHYIKKRYGTPCRAWSFWRSHHWY